MSDKQAIVDAIERGETWSGRQVFKFFGICLVVTQLLSVLFAAFCYAWAHYVQ